MARPGGDDWVGPGKTGSPESVGEVKVPGGEVLVGLEN